jgi:hypothetical protein
VEIKPRSTPSEWNRLTSIRACRGSRGSSVQGVAAPDAQRPVREHVRDDSGDAARDRVREGWVCDAHLLIPGTAHAARVSCHLTACSGKTSRGKFSWKWPEER